MTDKIINQKEALRILEGVSRGLQRYRSITFESTGMTENALAAVEPYSFGPGSLLLKITKMLDEQTVSAMEFFNLMYLLNTLHPELGVAIGVCEAAAGNDEFQLPTISPENLGEIKRDWELE